MSISNFYDPADYPMTMRTQFGRMAADVEYDRVDKDDLLTQLDDLRQDADDQVELAVRASDELEELEDTLEELEGTTEGLDTFTTRIELVIRELEWTQPDSDTVFDLRSALRGFMNGEVVTFA